MCRSYNRWLADIWREGEGRLLWVAVTPVLAMDEALKELRSAKENGACGLSLRGIEGNRLLGDPYFFPLYEEASRLDMPVIVHVGNANPGYGDLVSQYNGGGSLWKFRVPVMGACWSFIMAKIPDLFPTLRFRFLEAGAQWVPHIVHDLRRQLPAKGKQASDSLIGDSRMYVACGTDEDLEWIIKYTGEDNIVIGTDYGHTDQSSEIEALWNLRMRGAVSPAVIDKILSDNPRALYGL